MTKQSRLPAIYILANRRNGTLYTGVTNDLPRRVWQHNEKLVEGFSQKYDCTKLVYFEMLETMEAAIAREKQLKGGSRAKKLALIESMNPEWNDLYESLF
ncbi:MAG: GIY-YIG nuclease family protein [Alphaproteobacteria bacterium]|nr:GIY-YIG nuclease family protein [Alphaproteobacteria bacterium]